MWTTKNLAKDLLSVFKGNPSNALKNICKNVLFFPPTFMKKKFLLFVIKKSIPDCNDIVKQHVYSLKNISHKIKVKKKTLMQYKSRKQTFHDE